MRRLLIALFVGSCLAPDLCGQSLFNQQSVKPPTSAIDRRVLRERAVSYAGKAARPLVESEYGDEASLALLRCSKKTVDRLIELHATGGLSRLWCPGELLLCIAEPTSGDKVCKYVIEHANELADRDCSEVFLARPLDFVLELEQLPEAVRKSRNYRSIIASPPVPSKGPREFRSWAMGMGLGGLFVLLIWKVRQHKLRDAPA